MKARKEPHIGTQQEVNSKLFFQKLYKNKMLFILSIFLFVALAIVYISLAIPKYEVSTSILIDPSGSNRVLGESKYVDGGVGLIEMEKNLYNEIGIIKSYSLIKQTVEDLGFDISYHVGPWFKKREYYGYFPFEVILIKTQAQLYGVPFEIEILTNDRYRLFIDTNKFKVSNPSNGSIHEVDKDFNYSQIFSFGEEVHHAYFNFIIKKPEYNVNSEDFKGNDLSFIVHNLDGVANSYGDKIKVDNIDIQASIFKIVTIGALVDKEIDFLKKLTENYIQNKLISRNKIATTKETFIRNQLGAISDSLTKVELNLELFKKDKRALNLDATATNALGRTSNLLIEKAKIELDIKYYNSLIQNVENNRNSEDFVIPTSIGINDPLINENIIELKGLYAERSKKRFFVTNSNQEMTILNEQIKKSIGILLNNLYSAKKSSELALLRVMSQLSNYDGVISSLPERENQLLNIQRQTALYENLFNYLSQELAKTGIARAESTSDTRVLDEARMVGDKPVAPQKMLLLVLAFTLGTIVPLTKIVFFSSDELIENVGQIIQHTNVQVIANIAHHNSKSKISDSEISLWKVKESFRDLYANLRIIRPKKGCCVLGITSIMMEEGKTFCAVNLGIALAEAGKKTLIIDADLRSPSLVKNIYKIKGKGLSDYLKGEIKFSDNIIFPHDKLSNLQFIPTAVVDGNIHGLFSGDKIELLIHKLEDRYDYILFDTPPVGLVSDFLFFSDVIDINLFVVRRNVAKITFLEDLEKLMLRDKKKKSYIIFNDILGKEHKYGYGQKYGMNKEPQLIKDSLSV